MLSDVFYQEVNDLLNGCEEILTSSQLTTVLEYILAIGNYMNAHWNAKQRVQGFQISSIEKVNLTFIRCCFVYFCELFTLHTYTHMIFLNLYIFTNARC